MAITYFGSVGVPTDNGTSATSPVSFANPPIASMAAGDLVIIYAWCRSTGATIAIGTSGGQTWTSETAHSSSTATLTGRVFWCRFNGTWGAAPTVTFSATLNTNAVMHVFRPNTSTNTWGLSSASTTAQENTLTSRVAAATFGNPADAATYTPSQNNTVSLCIYSTDDDNTWNTPTSGFTQVTSPSAQFRNTSGNDSSAAFTYLIQSTAASINATGLNQATLGNDPGVSGLYIWYEFTPPTTFIRDMVGMGIIPYLR